MNSPHVAIEALRELVSLDGADLHLRSSSADLVEIDLILDGASCEECVMPRPFLEDTFRMLLVENGVDVAHVKVNDPRETGVN
jgi:hypothetical protein